MQKKFIALAVAGLVSGAAFAQSNVTIYGVADAGFVSSSGDRTGAQNGKANFRGIDSGILSGSRIGFKGEEGLGNGLKAVFTLEYSLSLDTNSGIGSGAAYTSPTAPSTTIATGLQARQQFVGLKSDKLGQVALGRQYAPGFGSNARNDALLASAAASPLAILNAAGGNTINAATPARINNAVTYTSPNFSGFTANVIYGYGETDGSAIPARTAATASNGISTGNDGFFGAGLNYANGPMNVDVVYQSRRGSTLALGPRTAAQATQDNVNEWMVGGSYDLKIVKLFATYQDQNDNNGTSATEAGNRVWSVGAVMPVFANGKIHASYADLSWDRTGAGGSDAWALGYTHAMSKRTTLYTTYTYTDNDRNTLVAAGGVGATRGIGEKNGTFTAGMNHSF